MKSIKRFAAFGLALTAAFTSAAATHLPPNLIVILTDDQGYADVGFNGCKDIPTPNLDSIARNGVQFTSGYVSFSVCSPSRAGLLTGRYEQRFGHERNPRFEPENRQSGLPLTETTLADTLGKVGYQSGIIGKWHLGAHPDLHPLKRGFNEFFGMLGGGHRYFPEELTLKETSQAKSQSEEDSYRLWILRNHEPVKTTQYLTDEFSDEAVRFIARHKAGPFFLYLAYNAPHGPLQATEKYLSRFPDIKNPNRRTYAAMVSAVDDGVGRVLDELRKQGMENNTLVFYLSDNGGPTQAERLPTTILCAVRKAVRGKVAFACRSPSSGRGICRKGWFMKSPSSRSISLRPSPPWPSAPANPDRPLDGVNLMPYLTGKQSGDPHDAIYLRMFDKGAFAVRTGDHKLVIPARAVKPSFTI